MIKELERHLPTWRSGRNVGGSSWRAIWKYGGKRLARGEAPGPRRGVAGARGGEPQLPARVSWSSWRRVGHPRRVHNEKRDPRRERAIFQREARQKCKARERVSLSMSQERKSSIHLALYLLFFGTQHARGVESESSTELHRAASADATRQRVAPAAGRPQTRRAVAPPFATRASADAHVA